MVNVNPTDAFTSAKETQTIVGEEQFLKISLDLLRYPKESEVRNECRITADKTQQPSGRMGEIVRSCKNSGLTVRAWYREHGLNEKTYYYRQKQVCNAIPANRAAVPVQFAEVGQPETMLREPGAVIQIHIGNAKIDVCTSVENEAASGGRGRRNRCGS